MGIIDRISRLVRSEVNAARRKAGDAWEDVEIPRPSASDPRREPTDSGAGRGQATKRPPADPITRIARAYARLEVPEGSDLKTVKKGYRKMMRRYHPDRHGSDPDKARIANEVAAALTDAYDTLVEHLS